MRILQRDAGGDFVEDRLEAELAQTRLSSPDRHLCQELAYGIVRWQATLDWLIARKTAGRTQKAALQDLLRLGLYQIFFLDRIPDHAAVYETVELAKSRGLGPQAGFINAVLRGYLREHDETQKKLDELKKLLAKPGVDKVLIFSDTKRSVEKLSEELRREGFKTESIHGNKRQSQRQKALDEFKSNKISVLVATDVAARGLDIKDVTHVINFTVPHTYDDYIHRIGRTGRMNCKGTAYTFA